MSTQRTTASPQLQLVVAMTKNRVIGHQGAMPWHLPRDLQHFKKVTLGQPVLMGRKTYDSIIASLGKPLPGRLNVVISRSDPQVADGVLTFKGIEPAMAALKAQGEGVVNVIGGGEIYQALLPFANTLYLTLIDAELEGDTWFPAIDFKQWQVTDTETHPADADNAYALSFVTLARATSASD